MKTSLFFNSLLGLILAGQNPRLISTSEIVKPSPAIAGTQEPLASVNATKQVTQTRRNCQTSAYVIDRDPQGLNVRSAPSTNARVIKKLPTDRLAVFVDITASQGNWVEISRAEDGESGTTIYQGKGWVYASLLGTGIRGYETRSVSAYASPNNRSRVVGRIPSNATVKLLSCSGDWVYVSYQQVQGWIARNDQCATPLTTCS